MFLVKDKSVERENRIRQTFEEDPPLGVILAAIHFEWTAKRAILKLGKSPTKQLKETFKGVFQWESYTKLWKKEVATEHKKRLHEIICNPKYLQEDAWNLRNELVHGAASCSSKHAKEKFEAFMDAAQSIRAFVKKRKFDIDAPLKTRKEK